MRVLLSLYWCLHEMLEFEHNFGVHVNVVSQWDLLTKGIFPEICLLTVSHGVSALQNVWNNRKKNRSRMWCPHEILEFKHNFGFHLKVVSPWCSARDGWLDAIVVFPCGWVTFCDHGWLNAATKYIEYLNTPNRYWIYLYTEGPNYCGAFNSHDIPIKWWFWYYNHQPTITNHSMVINPSPWYWTPPTTPGFS